MKILYIQYAGDFAEAYDNLINKNENENYYGQKYSVNAVIQQARQGNKVLVLVLKTGGYRIELERNLIAVGLSEENRDINSIKSEIEKFLPDRVILRTPNHNILKYLRENNYKTLPVFADSFERIPLFKLRRRLYRYLLGRELKNKFYKWVANHQLNASISVKNLGVNSKKILPYDWEHSDRPSNWKKTIPENLLTKELVIFYAGVISERKGVFDLIRSAKFIIDSGRGVIVKIAGKGDTDKIRSLVAELGLGDRVQLLGLIEHGKVLTNMNTADVVVVPSHHAYPEGLPMTIMEGLMVQTPVIASDHPMFLGRVGLRGSVVFFKEKDAEDLGEKILSICSNPCIYRDMVSSAASEWNDLVLELKWADLINNWINYENFDFSPYSLWARCGD